MYSPTRDRIIPARFENVANAFRTLTSFFGLQDNHESESEVRFSRNKLHELFDTKWVSFVWQKLCFNIILGFDLSVFWKKVCFVIIWSDLYQSFTFHVPYFSKWVSIDGNLLVYVTTHPRSKIVSSWRTLFLGTVSTTLYNFLIDFDLTWIQLYYLEETYLSEKLIENSRNMRALFNFDPFSFETPIYSKSTYKTNDKSTFLENIVK